MQDDEWITAEEAAQLTGLSPRSVLRYGSGQEKRLRTRKRTGSKRLFYHRADVLALAEELEVAKRPPPLPPEPKPEMLPAGAMLQIVRQRDEDIDRLQREIRLLTAELARAQSDVAQRALPGQVEEVERKLTAAEIRLETAIQERDDWRSRYDRLSGQTRRVYIVLAVLFAILLVALAVFVVLVAVRG